MKAIKKLQEHNIFKKDSIIESVITKDWMGSPVEKKVHLIEGQFHNIILMKKVEYLRRKIFL